jgi:hypothetical protein
MSSADRAKSKICASSLIRSRVKGQEEPHLFDRHSQHPPGAARYGTQVCALAGEEPNLSAELRRAVSRDDPLASWPWRSTILTSPATTTIRSQVSSPTANSTSPAATFCSTPYPCSTSSWAASSAGLRLCHARLAPPLEAGHYAEPPVLIALGRAARGK